MGRGFLISAVIAAFISIACGVLDLDPPCPTVPEGDTDTFDMAGFDWDVDQAIKDLLNDPDSYVRENTLARRGFSDSRADGTRYYTQVEVDFRAKNIYGGVVPGYAYVQLSENADGDCKIEDTRLHSGE